jgi:hypothetical protein
VAPEFLALTQHWIALAASSTLIRTTFHHSSQGLSDETPLPLCATAFGVGDLIRAKLPSRPASCEAKAIFFEIAIHAGSERSLESRLKRGETPFLNFEFFRHDAFCHQDKRY